jgi:hypothetical protein
MRAHAGVFVSAAVSRCPAPRRASVCTGPKGWPTAALALVVLAAAGLPGRAAGWPSCCRRCRTTPTAASSGWPTSSPMRARRRCWSRCGTACGCRRWSPPTRCRTAFLLRLCADAQLHALKPLFRGITLVPLLAPSLLSAISLIYWFGNQGVLKSWMQALGIDQIYGAPGIVLAEIFCGVSARADDPGDRAAGIADARLYEAADAMGTSAARKFFTITLPGAKYGLISAAWWSSRWSSPTSASPRSSAATSTCWPPTSSSSSSASRTSSGRGGGHAAAGAGGADLRRRPLGQPPADGDAHRARRALPRQAGSRCSTA